MQSLACQRDRARARGGAAHGQVVAQLDAIGPAGPGGKGRRDVTHADFDLYTSVHGIDLFPKIPGARFAANGRLARIAPPGPVRLQSTTEHITVLMGAVERGGKLTVDEVS
jgi:hypothetical protein